MHEAVLAENTTTPGRLHRVLARLDGIDRDTAEGLNALNRRVLPLTGGGSRGEAPPGFEPGVEVLQTSALPLGYGARLGSEGTMISA